MDRRARIREYKDTPRPAGVYIVRNHANGKVLVGSSTDLPGALNRQRFQLQNGAHPDRSLQDEWNALGADAFTFEVLDELKPSSKPEHDPSEDLRVLKTMWLEKLTAASAVLYPFCKQRS